MAPVNDNFANRIIIPSASYSYGPIDVSTATVEPGEPFDSGFFPGQFHQTTWWEYTPPTDMKLRIDPDGSMGQSNEFERFWSFCLYTGSTFGTMVEHDLALGNGEACQMDFIHLTAGVTYMLQVSTTGFGATPAILQFTFEATPPNTRLTNNLFANRITLPGSTGSTDGTNYHTYTEPWTYEFPSDTIWLGEGGPMWYEWVCPTDGEYTFTVSGDLGDLTSRCSGSGFTNSPLLAAFIGTDLADLVFEGVNGGNVPAFGPRTEMAFYARAGTTYFITVDDFQDGEFPNFQGGDFTLSWSPTTCSGPPDEMTANVFIWTPADVFIEIQPIVSPPDRSTKRIDVYRASEVNGPYTLAEAIDMPFTDGQGTFFPLNGDATFDEVPPYFPAFYKAIAVNDCGSTKSLVQPYGFTLTLPNWGCTYLTADVHRFRDLFTRASGFGPNASPYGATLGEGRSPVSSPFNAANNVFGVPFSWSQMMNAAIAYRYTIGPHGPFTFTGKSVVPEQYTFETSYGRPLGDHVHIGYSLKWENFPPFTAPWRMSWNSGSQATITFRQWAGTDANNEPYHQLIGGYSYDGSEAFDSDTVTFPLNVLSYDPLTEQDFLVIWLVYTGFPPNQSQTQDTMTVTIPNIDGLRPYFAGQGSTDTIAALPPFGDVGDVGVNLAGTPVLGIHDGAGNHQSGTYGKLFWIGFESQIHIDDQVPLR